MKTSKDSRKGSNNQVIALEPGEGNSYWVLGDLYTFKVECLERKQGDHLPWLR
jgi:hypothetical protein